METPSGIEVFEAFRAFVILGIMITLLVTIVTFSILAVDSIRRRVKKKRKKNRNRVKRDVCYEDVCSGCPDENTIACPFYKGSRPKRLINWVIDLWNELSEWPKYPY